MKISSASPASVRSFLGVALLLVICFAIEASAKRGCSAFGHSCFGGHGKRSDVSGRVEDAAVPEDVSSNQESQDYETQRAGGGEILIADAGPVYQDRPMPRFQPLQVLSPQQQHPRYNLSPFIRQWLASYNRHANSMDFDTK